MGEVEGGIGHGRGEPQHLVAEREFLVPQAVPFTPEHEGDPTVMHLSG